MQFLRKYKSALIAFAAILLLAGGWVLIWQRIGDQVEKAGYEAAFEAVTLGGAVYGKCDDTVLACYTAVPAAECIGAEIAGGVSADTPAGTVSCRAWRCKPLAEAGLRDAVIFVEHGDAVSPYELTGYTALGKTPDVAEVCDAYGIASAADIAAVEVCDADGSSLDTLTESSDIASFYKKLTALGAALSDEEITQHYYAAYVAEYGESDDVAIVGGEVTAADDAAYEKVMTLWSKGLCLVHIRLKNGLQLRNTVYSPAAGMYTFYATYALEVPFFS